MDEFCYQAQLPKHINEKIRKALEYSSNKNILSNQVKEDFFESIPTKLKTSLAVSMFKGTITSVPFLKNKDNIFLANLLPMLQPLKLSKGEYIYKKDSYPNLVYFIIEGKVNFLIGSNELVFKSFLAGSYFGEIEIFHQCLRLFSVQCEQNCELLTLDRDYFHELMEKFPQVEQEMLEMAQKRQEFLNDSLEKIDMLLNINQNDNFWNNKETISFAEILMRKKSHTINPSQENKQQIDTNKLHYSSGNNLIKTKNQLLSPLFSTKEMKDNKNHQQFQDYSNEYQNQNNNLNNMQINASYNIKNNDIHSNDNINSSEVNLQNSSQNKLISRLQNSQSYDSKNNPLFNSISHTTQNYTIEYSTQNSNNIDSQVSIKQNNAQNSNIGVKNNHQNSFTSIEKSLQYQQQVISNYHKQSETNLQSNGKNNADNVAAAKNIKIHKKTKLDYHQQGSVNSNSSSNININSINEQSSLTNIPLQTSQVSLKNKNIILNVFNEKQEPMLVEVYEEDQKQTKMCQIQSTPSLKILNQSEILNFKQSDNKNINKLQHKYGVSSLDSIEEKNSHIDVENPSNTIIPNDHPFTILQQMNKQRKERQIKLQKINKEKKQESFQLDKGKELNEKQKVENNKSEIKEDPNPQLKIKLKKDSLLENANKIYELIKYDEQQDNSYGNEDQSTKNQFNQNNTSKILSNSIQDKTLNNSSSSPEYLIAFGQKQNSNKAESPNFNPISFSEAIQRKTNNSNSNKNNKDKNDNKGLQKNLNKNINYNSEIQNQFNNDLINNTIYDKNTQKIFKNNDNKNHKNTNDLIDENRIKNSNILNNQLDSLSNKENDKQLNNNISINIGKIKNQNSYSFSEGKQLNQQNVETNQEVPPSLNRGNNKKKTIMKSQTLKLENEYDNQNKNIQYSDRLDKIYNINSQQKVQTPQKDSDASKNRSLQEINMLDTSPEQTPINSKQHSNQTKSSKQNIFNFISDFKNDNFDSDPQTEKRNKSIKKNQKTQTSFNTEDQVNQSRKPISRQKQSKKTFVSIKSNIQQEKNNSTMQDFDIQSLNYLNKNEDSQSEVSSSMRTKDFNYNEIPYMKKVESIKVVQNVFSEQEEIDQEKNNKRKANSKSKITRLNEYDSEDLLQFSNSSIKEQKNTKKRCKSLGIRSKSNSSITKDPTMAQSQNKIKITDFNIDAKSKSQRIQLNKKSQDIQRGRKKSSRKSTQVSKKDKDKKNSDKKNSNDDTYQTNQNSKFDVCKVHSQPTIKDLYESMNLQSRSLLNFSRNLSHENSQQKQKNEGGLSIQNMMKPIEIDLQEEIERKTKKLLKKMTLRSFDDFCDSTPDYCKMMDENQQTNVANDKYSANREIRSSSKIQNNKIKERMKLLKSMGSFQTSQNSINSSLQFSNSNLSPQTPINKQDTLRLQLMDEKSKELTFTLMVEKEDKQQDQLKNKRGKSQISSKSKKTQVSKSKKPAKNNKSAKDLKLKHKPKNYEINKGSQSKKQKIKENNTNPQKSKKIQNMKQKQNPNKDQNKKKNQKSNLIEMTQMRQNFSDISNKMDSLSQQYENMLNLVFLLTQEIQSIQEQGQIQNQGKSRLNTCFSKPMLKKQVNKMTMSQIEMEEINHILSDLDLQSPTEYNTHQQNNIINENILLTQKNNIQEQIDDYNQV